ncbi:MAG: (d)CMP kinase [Kordiimonadaceae bacterium]|jgi:CMP/dCMP kinase|nr:(d)CMP kinase [Kordiimonadaceae bacterium]MBT6035713.1 (d)CMP kinase [Kordiimonadaceae bacterium]MBT6330632.1 (d)CMP kinase [Kordiimonadaceae bacterium]MBT7581755.1 (d)CMP kinase [Kordiimonadaceae bacterium]
MPSLNKFIIAIDGPAASGKGTLAKKLAEHYNLALLDTGALYRAVGWNVLKDGGDTENEADALKASEKLAETDLKNPALRTESIAAAASKVAGMPAVRQTLVDFQRHFAHNPPPGKDGTILDGRDIGTVICPDAPIKIFITANVETRAKRRFLEEFGDDGTNEDFLKILSVLKARDELDMNRAASPLKKAENAYLIDTSVSDIEAVFEAAKAYVSSISVE